MESNSAIIIGWLASGICLYWFLWDYWEAIKEIAQEINARFCHIFREANMVADHLAKEGT